MRLGKPGTKTFHKIELRHGYFAGFDDAGKPIITTDAKEVARYTNSSTVALRMKQLRAIGERPKKISVTMRLS